MVAFSHTSSHSRRVPFVAFVVPAAILSLATCDRAVSHRPDTYDVTATFPHDSDAYTQGLVWADSFLYESTGRYGHSELRREDLRTGRVLASRALPANRFGEGLALLRGRLYQLTWKEGIAYTYDAATLTPRDSFHYAGEGWGLATDGTKLIMSDDPIRCAFCRRRTFAWSVSCTCDTRTLLFIS